MSHVEYAPHESTGNQSRETTEELEVSRMIAAGWLSKGGVVKVHENGQVVEMSSEDFINNHAGGNGQA